MSFEYTLPPPPRLLFDEAADLIINVDATTERLTSTDSARDPDTERLSSSDIFPSDLTDRDASDRTDMQLHVQPGVSHKVSLPPAPRALRWTPGAHVPRPHSKTSCTEIICHPSPPVSSKRARRVSLRLSEFLSTRGLPHPHPPPWLE